jgi:ribosome-associated protein
MIDFKLTSEYIELVRLLKAVNLVSSGGEAKMAVTEKMVKVNGKTETRKRLKLRKGAVVSFKEEKIKIV